MSRVDFVVVDRLFEFYNPFRQFFARNPTLATIRKTPVVPGRDAVFFSQLSDRQETRWNKGRVRYFVELLERGVTLDPVEIDNQCDRGHIYGPILLDGHHRFCAAILLKVPVLRARYGGRVDTLRYLTGKADLPPGDLT